MQRKTENAAQNAAESVEGVNKSVEGVNKSVENGAQSVQERAQSEKNGVKSGAQSETTTGQTVSGTEKGAQSEKSPVKVSPYTVIKSPYEGKSPSNKADTKNERVEVSAESFAEGKSIYEIRTNGTGQTGIATKVKKALLEILKSIGGQHSVVVENVEFGGKPYEVTVNTNIAGKLAGDPNPSAEKFAVLKNIDGIIKNAEYVGSGDYIQHTTKEKNVTRYDYFETKATINDKPYVVSFDVEVYPDTNNYRTHKVINEISLTKIPAADTGPVPAATDIKPSLQGDISSPEIKISQNKGDVNTQNEYSEEYQKGAEHPNTVGGMESKPGSYYAEMNRTGAQPDKSITKHRYSDYDAYLDDPNVVVYSADKKALERKVYNEYKGERTVWQETVDGVIDGDTYFTEDGKYYVKTAEGKTRRVAQGAYRFAGFLRCDDI